jgi:hypothetical protein
MYIFIDESGDLGFKEKSSKWFLFTFAITENHRSLEKIVYKTWKNLKKKHKRLGELHAYHSDDSTRRKILKLINRSDTKVAYGFIEKASIPVKLRRDKENLYTQIICFAINLIFELNIIKSSKNLHIYIDRKDIDIKSVNILQANINHVIRDIGHIDFSVEIESSHKNKSLQAVDFLSWAFFRKLEKDDARFVDYFEKAIIDMRNISI